MSYDQAKFPADHWSKNWDLLEGIAKEFSSLRELYGWTAGVQDSTVNSHFKSIVENSDYPYIVQLHQELANDPHLLQTLDYYIEAGQTKWPSDQIRCQLYVRINIKCWRNSSKWILNRDKREHWACFRNDLNLKKDIKRTENVLDALAPPIEGTAPQSAQSDTVVVSNEVAHAGNVDHGYDFVDAVDLIVEDGLASGFEGKVFLDWYRISEEDDCCARIASKYKLTTKGLNDIIRKFTSGLSMAPQPTTLAK